MKRFEGSRKIVSLLHGFIFILILISILGCSPTEPAEKSIEGYWQGQVVLITNDYTTQLSFEFYLSETGSGYGELNSEWVLSIEGTIVELQTVDKRVTGLMNLMRHGYFDMKMYFDLRFGFDNADYLKGEIVSDLYGDFNITFRRTFEN